MQKNKQADMPAQGATPVAFWENRYREADAIWSGRVNATTADVVSGLAPGKALDLGSGEGGDAIWLAQQGWDALGLDLSHTAVARATAAAHAVGPMPGNVQFSAVDLENWAGEDNYQLVTASFFHSPVALTRERILRNGASCVAPGGHLLIVSHAAMPPWAPAEAHQNHHFLTPGEEIVELDLDSELWAVRIAEVRARNVTAPNGTEATLDDGVVLLQRVS